MITKIPNSDSLIAVTTVETNPTPLNVALVAPKQTNKFSDPSDLVALATEVSRANEGVRATACSKLRQITEQIRFLQQQASEVLKEAQKDTDLHKAACNMVKKPGNVYSLYRRTSGQVHLSFLTPHEWGTSCPHEFLGSYRLEWDHSWTPIEDIAERDAQDDSINRIITGKLAIKDSS